MTQQPPEERKLYRVQIGAYAIKANAEAQLARAKRQASRMPLSHIIKPYALKESPAKAAMYKHLHASSLGYNQNCSRR